MNNLIVSSVLVLVASSAAHAQQAVQWKVSDGGNGHWYQFVRVAGTINWPSARNAALAANGDLAVIDSPQLTAFLDVYYPAATNACFIGCQRTADTWRWVNGQPVSWTNWCSCGQPSGDGPVVEIWSGGVWNDVSTAEARQGYLVEWSTDCNNDAIVDHGQILDGSVTDVNDDGVPDSCQAPCTLADLTDDGMVDGSDLSALLSDWGAEAVEASRADINADHEVNGVDLALVLGGWGPCPE